ncbi:MAG TPA: ribulose-phosphate 3-epimerase [Gemmataceae bacterium]|nr:ribulose-phosphate 3-epimerase [Gemmataceae bacterium]
MIAIAPSILSADFAKLGNQVLECEKAGANRIHVDVMDGHFVPNLSMGPEVVKALRPVTKMPLEVHLMIEDPVRYSGPFLKAGANTIIAHCEVLSDPRPWIRQVHDQGAKAGIAVKPNTPIEIVEPYLAELDLLLCMTVEPGFGGQAFLPESPERIRRMRAMLRAVNPKCDLEVDGGIEQETARIAVESGANVLVAGTSVFHSPLGANRAIQAFRKEFANS